MSNKRSEIDFLKTGIAEVNAKTNVIKNDLILVICDQMREAANSNRMDTIPSVLGFEDDMDEDEQPIVGVDFREVKILSPEGKDLGFNRAFELDKSKDETLIVGITMEDEANTPMLVRQPDDERTVYADVNIYDDSLTVSDLLEVAEILADWLSGRVVKL